MGLKKTIGYCILALQVLLVFVLIFQRAIELPPWLQAGGRVHPLILHVPIGLILVAALLVFARNSFGGSTLDEVIALLLYLTAFSASLTALTGIFLSREGGYADDTLFLHKWLGVSLSFLCWAIAGMKADSLYLKVTMTAAVVVLIAAGHFGASLTHGENFVLAPLEREDVASPKTVTDTTTLFHATIESILENKCFGCHNEQKAKGRLIMTDFDRLMAGGKTGPLWVAGDPAHSLIVDRLTLPVDAKKHMPPKDKAQLTGDELQFIQSWIRQGANTAVRLSALSPDDTLARLAMAVIARYSKPDEHSRYHFSFAEPDLIRRLNTPNRNVFQVALHEPALQADFFLSGSFQVKFLEELRAVREQLVSINLTRMPVTDADLAILADFPQLEKVILNNTHINGSGLSHLAGLENLTTVSLSGTQVDAASVEILSTNKAIRDVFVWNTRVESTDVATLEQKASGIHWEIGYQPDENEKLRLSPPFVRNDNQVVSNDEFIEFRHKLPGVIIRYTLNGSDPDSASSPIYNEPVMPAGYTIVKTKAFKDGWLSSDPKEYIFFRKGHRPERVELRTSPEPQYPGEGGETLIDDKKGMPDFYRAPVWMGFRNQPLEALFFFPKAEPPTVSAITLSYARNVGAMCMPPALVEVWGGNNAADLRLLANVVPDQPTEYLSTRIEGATVTIPPSTFSCYRILARPLEKLPAFREAPKDKGWLMVDEVFFN